MADQVALEEVMKYITQTAGRYGVDVNHAQAILLAENMGGNGAIPAILSNDKTSPRGAAGVMQVMPMTKLSLVSQGHLSEDHAESSDWQSSVNAGLAALKEIQKRTKTTSGRVLAAEYNAGPKAGRMMAAGETDRLPAETLNYLKKFEFAQSWLQGIPHSSGLKPSRR